MVVSISIFWTALIPTLIAGFVMTMILKTERDQRIKQAVELAAIEINNKR